MKKERHVYVVVALYLVIFLAFFVSALSDFIVPSSIVGQEDTFFSYNLTANLSSDSWDEGLLFSIVNISAFNYTSGFAGNGSAIEGYPWISFNSSTGIFTINSTFDNQTARYVAWFVVTNSSGQSRGDSFTFNITPVNDAPSFQNLSNSSFNMSQAFTRIIRVVDEENNYPYVLNISFLSCSVAQWSTRNCSTEEGMTLFNSSYYSFNQTSGILNITFDPQRNDVGSYIIGFNVTDSGNFSLPYNASYLQIVNYTVLVINSKPFFTYVCENERQATEDAAFSCYVNATDIDEVNNLTIRSNASASYSFLSANWFTFNSTPNSHIKTVPVNLSTTFNASWLVNFTPSDYNVGNWSINLTINDTGSPIQLNSTTFYFYVANVNDNVLLDDIAQTTVYLSNNYSFILNASDDDLLIPDKSVYYETLNFTSNNSFVSITPISNTSNKTVARISFNPNNLGIGSHRIMFNVSDKSGSSDFTILNLTVLNNTPPSWNQNTQVNFTLNESVNFYYNLSANVTDLENDVLSFTYINYSYFPNFNLSSAGIINLTSNDLDVGKHNLVINVSDGITSTALSFTFEVFNLNETPILISPLIEGYNITVNSTNNAINASEDSASNFSIQVVDEDFKIQSTFKSYYNESLQLNATVQGPNTNLFNIRLTSPAGVYNLAYPNMSLYSITFNPNKSDVGTYNITLNVTDRSGLSSIMQFNLTITDINHYPSISAIANQTSKINSTFVLDINASDIEDGTDNGNLTYTLEFLTGVDFVEGNQSIFNITSGLLNITFNDSQAGFYSINLTVNDSTQMFSSRVFYLKVYGFPVFLYPSSSDLFNLTENSNYNLSVIVNHSVGDILNYSFYINDTLRYNSTGFGNGSYINWSITPSFYEETGNNLSNATIFVSNLIYPELNATLNFLMNVSHANAPVIFNGSIPNQQKNYDQSITVNLEDYFLDVDSSDPIYNQSINFTVMGNMSSSAITVSFINGSAQNDSLILTFTSSSATSEIFNITANDSEYQNYSNQFTITFTTPTQSTSSSSSSGGGGSSQVRPVSLNIIVPGQLTARKQDRLIVPISLVNTGKVTLNNLFLQNTIAKNGLLREDLIASFDFSTFQSLIPGETKNLTLIVDINTREPGLYEVTLNGTSTSPVYSDTSKLYVNVEEGDTIAERISFTQEFIAQNPQCIEIKEIVDEARELYVNGETEKATDKVDEALNACKQAISQSSRSQVRDKVYQSLTDNIGLTALVALGVGVGYYWFRRFMLQREHQNIEGKL